MAARLRKSCEATLARADGVVLVNRWIFLTSTTPAAATASAFPSSALEELKIGLNGFNELVLPILAAIPRHLAGNGGVPLLKLAVPRLRRS